MEHAFVRRPFGFDFEHLAAAFNSVMCVLAGWLAAQRLPVVSLLIRHWPWHDSHSMIMVCACLSAGMRLCALSIDAHFDCLFCGRFKNLPFIYFIDLITYFCKHVLCSSGLLVFFSGYSRRCYDYYLLNCNFRLMNIVQPWLPEFSGRSTFKVEINILSTGRTLVGQRYRVGITTNTQ